MELWGYRRPVHGPLSERVPPRVPTSPGGAARPGWSIHVNPRQRAREATGGSASGSFPRNLRIWVDVTAEAPLTRAHQGSMIGAPVFAMSEVLRVTTARPWTIAVAASRASIDGTGLPASSPRAAMRPHSSATGSSMRRMRPLNRSRRSPNHFSSEARRREVVSLAIPFSSSPSVKTLTKSVPSGTCANQASTDADGSAW